MERASFSSFMTRNLRDRTRKSGAELELSPIPAWTLQTPESFSDELTNALERRKRSGWPVVIVMLSSDASFAPDFWRFLKKHSIRAVSLAEQYRDRVGTEGFLRAVQQALAAQDRGIGVQKKAIRQEQKERAQEEAAVDDLSVEEEEQLFEMLTAVRSR